VFEHLHMMWLGIWVHPHTTFAGRGQIMEIWG
jgi:hypothetical protein